MIVELGVGKEHGAGGREGNAETKQWACVQAIHSALRLTNPSVDGQTVHLQTKQRWEVRRVSGKWTRVRETAGVPTDLTRAFIWSGVRGAKAEGVRAVRRMRVRVRGTRSERVKSEGMIELEQTSAS